MFKYTKHSLKKLEELLKDIEYQIRYEKGSFQSGYCMVEDRKIAVVNKFFDTEARINTLLEILNQIEVNESLLSESSQKFYKQILKLNNRELQEEKTES